MSRKTILQAFKTVNLHDNFMYRAMRDSEWIRKPLIDAHKFNKLTGKISKALTMPKWYAEYMFELEKGVANLIRVRGDLDPELIKKEVNQKVQEIYSGLPSGTSGLQVLKVVSAGLYNKACAGEPMPWEVER